MMRAPRFISIGLLATLFSGVLILGSSTTATAGVPTCFGSPATPGHLGTPGDDEIDGTSGNDVLIGLGGKDVIDGKGGSDIICGGEDANSPDGADTIHGGAGFETIVGGGGNDKLFGDADRDNMFGSAGNDLINGGGNAPGVGDDANFWFASNPIVANLANGTATGEGNDELVGIEGLGGSGQNDKLTGNNEQNSMDGGIYPSGNDVLNGAGGNDTLSLNFEGFVGYTGSIFVNLEAGTSNAPGSEDTLKGLEYVVGSSYNDYITGTDGVNALFGADGNDTIFGRGGDDAIVGFQGDDLLFGGVGIADFVSYSDQPTMTVNIDLLDGTATRADGNDILEGVEMVEGSDEGDQITGDHGPNFFFMDEGDDDIDGKGGSDLIFFLGATGPVVADLGLGQATGMALTYDEIDNVEHMVGGSYADNLTGNDARNFINGSGGVDWVKGVEGDDYLAGGEKNDILEGGDGNRDLVDFFQSKNPVNANLQSGEATGEGNDDLIDVEGLSGSGKGDTLRGNGADNFLYGMNGVDDLFGLGGDDDLDGGKKTDSLSGGPNSDECFTKPEATGCESFKKPGEHPLTEVGRRYKRALASARRYK